MIATEKEVVVLITEPSEPVLTYQYPSLKQEAIMVLSEEKLKCEQAR